MEKANTTNLEIRIDNDLKKQFEKICQENAYNKSEIIRRLVKNFIEEKEGF